MKKIDIHEEYKILSTASNILAAVAVALAFGALAALTGQIPSEACPPAGGLGMVATGITALVTAQKMQHLRESTEFKEWARSIRTMVTINTIVSVVLIVIPQFS